MRIAGIKIYLDMKHRKLIHCNFSRERIEHEIFLDRTFGSAPAFYFIKTCISSITEAGNIRNKHRPVTDFVRVVSVGACPKPMTVDTPVRFIPRSLVLVQTPDSFRIRYRTWFIRWIQSLPPNPNNPVVILLNRQS